jgi:hypothetical protein
VDLVVLKFHATDVPFLKLGKSTSAVEGQKVIVIGNPTGLMGTVFVVLSRQCNAGTSSCPSRSEAAAHVGWLDSMDLFLRQPHGYWKAWTPI